MYRTTKQANTKKVKWTPPHIVSQQKRNHNYFNNRNCQNISDPKNYTSPPSAYLSPSSHHNSTLNNSNQLNINKNKNNKHTTTDSTQSVQNYQQRKNDLLTPLKDFVASLSTFLQASTQETALVLLNCSDELERRNEMVEFFQQDPSYIPISARFKYKLTSSDLLTGDQIYIENAAKCEQILDLTQKLLRKHTFIVVKREAWAARKHLQEKFIEHGLTITQMLTLYEKIQFKTKYGNLPFPDGYLAKVALYNYIFADADNISLYLDCDLDSITKLLQTRLNLSQDGHTKNTSNDTASPAQPNDNNHTNTQDNTSPTITNTNSPSPTPESQSTINHAQLPPIPPPNDTDTLQPTTHTSPTINNNTNCNIHVTTNQNNINNTTNDNDNQSNSPPQVSTTTPNTSTNTTRRTLVNPYARAYTYTSPNITTANNRFPTTRPSNPNPNQTQHNNTITPTHTNQPTGLHNQRHPTPNTNQNINSNSTNNTTNSDDNTTINELLRLFDQETCMDATSQSDDTEPSNTMESQDILDPLSEPRTTDITLETFPNCKSAYDLTTTVSKKLAEILPMLTYGFREEKTTIENEEEAATTALAWYNQLKLKTATEQVVQALDSQPTATPQTLQALITDTVEQQMAKASPKLAKSIEKNLRKNSSGQTRAQTSTATTNDSGLNTQTSTDNLCDNPSPNISLQNTQRLTPHFTTLSHNPPTTPNNNSKSITWDDYLTNKQKKQLKIKQRFQRPKYKHTYARRSHRPTNK